MLKRQLNRRKNKVQYRGVNELRRLYLDFFESKGHLKMKSFSLVPHNDNSLLIINSGMAPLKPYFTGQELPRPMNSFCLKIIAKREVTKHFKECTVSCCLTNIFNITCTDTLLTSSHSSSWWDFLTEVVGLDAIDYIHQYMRRMMKLLKSGINR